MEVNTAAGSPIARMTLDRTMGGGKQEHKIRWVALANCPDGSIIQRITRNTRTTHGKALTDNFGNPTGKFFWEKTAVVRADYYELWEVWKGNVFPAKSAVTGGGMYRSHDGLQSRAWFGDSYIDPDRSATRARRSAVVEAPASHAVPRGAPAVAAPIAALPADVYHDIFSDTVQRETHCRPWLPRHYAQERTGGRQCPQCRRDLSRGDRGRSLGPDTGIKVFTREANQHAGMTAGPGTQSDRVDIQ